MARTRGYLNTPGSGSSGSGSAFSMVTPNLAGTTYWGIPGSAGFNSVGTFAQAINTDYFVPFHVTKTITVDTVSLHVSSAVAGTAYAAIVPMGNDMQPTSAVLAQGTFDTSTTGRKDWSPALVLQPGLYLMIFNLSAGATTKFWFYHMPDIGHFATDPTGVNLIANFTKARAAGAWSGTPTWDTIGTGAINGTGGWSAYYLLKWTPT